jgi:putative ATPase
MSTATLFDTIEATSQPLAERLRPQSIDEVIGQDHLLAEGQLLSQAIANKSLPSIILWGPPGSGKTTLAKLLAGEIGAAFETLSAVQSGAADLKKMFDSIRMRSISGKRTVLFIDEIHRFNRAQQDVLLPVVESGLFILIGATTENPSFELNSALLSRAHVLVLKRLDEEALSTLITRAETALDKPLPLTAEARTQLIQMADGDGRSLLNLCELLFHYSGQPMNTEALGTFIHRRAPLYDKSQESHYNLISALHKSLRGSDANAALYWFCRMLDGGEDPLYIARRLIRFASEDIGLADPQALTQMLAARDAYEQLGSPEGELALVQGLLYLATAPKSNAAYVGYKSAMRSAKEHGSLMPPAHILNAPTKLMKELGYGKGYAYDHDGKDGFSGQNYFPDGMKREEFYQPKEVGFEREVHKRLEYWAKLRKEKQNT